MKRMDTLLDFLDFPFTFQIQPTKRMVYCALRTKTTLKQQYLTLSTSHAVTMGDTSSTSITGHILRFRPDTLHTPSMNSAKYRFTVYVDINFFLLKPFVKKYAKSNISNEISKNAESSAIAIYIHNKTRHN